MPLLLPMTDTAIADCRNHINSHPDIDLAILAYLTRHVNGLMCAEIETVVTRLIRERIEQGCDNAAANFLASFRRSVVRNAKYAEIGDKLALFGDEFKQRYEDAVDNSVGESGIQKLGIAVGKRDDTAHRAPPNITFKELEEAYTAATAIVDAVAVALQ